MNSLLLKRALALAAATVLLLTFGCGQAAADLRDGNYRLRKP